MEQIIQLLIKATPEFESILKEHRKSWGGEIFEYLELQEYAKYLVSLYENNSIEKLIKAFDSVECIYLDGDENTKTAIVVGLLESFQNELRQRGIRLDALDDYFGVQTKKYWLKLIDDW